MNCLKKKLLGALVLVMLIFSLTACDTEDNNSEPSVTQTDLSNEAANSTDKENASNEVVSTENQTEYSSESSNEVISKEDNTKPSEDANSITEPPVQTEANIESEPTVVVPEPTEVVTEAVTENNPSQQRNYVLNTSTKKFHYPSCKRQPDKNRAEVFCTREELISQGYSPCGVCHP